MRLIVLYLLIALISKASCATSLLEMSQNLWSKFLNGGLVNIGPLDPLRIPMVKVDQSQNKTNYRIILKNIEITGLNQSTLESIHIGKGSVKSNLSEYEAGYVSYSDRNVIDSIRYRFHTVVKEPKTQDSEELRVQPIETFEESESENRYANDQSQRRYNNQQSQQRYTNGQQRFNNDQQNQQRYSNNQQNQQRYTINNQERFNNQQNQQRYNDERFTNQHHQQNSEQQPQGTQGSQYQEGFDNRRSQSNSDRYNNNYRGNQQHRYQSRPQENVRPKESQSHGRDQELYLVYAQSQTNYENQRREQKNQDPRVHQPQSFVTESSVETQKPFTNKGSPTRFSLNLRARPPCVHEEKDAETFNVKDRNGESQRLENQPGYVDIVYADQNSNKERHFGNLRIEPKKDRIVYRLSDLMKDLDSHRKFIIHNFTESELLLKRNDGVRTAEESKRIKDLIRYAKDFQEEQGYFEEGMEITYHFGNETEPKVFDGKRTKRAHEDENEDDIIHVIMKIHAPLIKVKSGYVLMGSVGKQVLRGDGVLNAQFTDVTGEFTVELKKTGNTTMIVRAARARLQANSKNVTFQGMDENGPVEEILTQGLLAAEAVAAMLADDLATKALNDTVTDAIIYKMYKELPNNS
ncbi:uncharacterized protein LOC123268004 [Cotesia glomerata]|uniref:uncharacterized protein LOC123268004 n=1 Tax=Cotesia glomerata TaxID=32391 RepID=UPI001D007151|nr:uncharacterized protein LOC123268004 [Cotesia glomerata]